MPATVLAERVGRPGSITWFRALCAGGDTPRRFIDLNVGHRSPRPHVRFVGALNDRFVQSLSVEGTRVGQ